MIEFGKTLREAREAKGLTASQVAEKTHMMTSMVEDLENEDFRRIAAPIYGRGFVKLYCQTVGIEAKPMIDEFMEIFNGKRDLTIKERVVKPEEPPREAAPIEPAEPAAPIVDEPTAAEPPPLSIDAFITAPEPPRSIQPDLFGDPMPSTPATPRPARASTVQKPVAADRNFSRYASPLHEHDNVGPTIRPLIWRWVAIGVIGLIAIWVVAIGIRALYRATSDAKPAEPVEVIQKPAAPRTPIKVDPLYID